MPFTSSQRQTIIDMRTSIEAGIAYQGNMIKYGDIYQYMADVSKNQSGVDARSIEWLYGASEVNKGVGDFSAFIRAYTRAQSDIRLKTNPTDAQLQTVSDNIAKAVIADALTLNGIPSLTQIGSKDANTVATGFFNGDAAGWSGNLMFAGLGDSTPFMSNIIGDKTDTYNVLAMIKSAKIAGQQLDFLGKVNVLWTLIETTWSISGVTDALQAVSSEELALINGVYRSPSILPSVVDHTQIVLGTVAGNDPLLGSANLDYIHGGGGNDIMNGADGNDIVDGGTGNDILEGGKGSDLLVGGKGDDQLNGGDGSDTYGFSKTDGKDVITDSDGQGQIVIDGKLISGAAKYVNATTWTLDGYTLQKAGADTKIIIDANNEITITGLSAAAPKLGIILPATQAHDANSFTFGTTFDNRIGGTNYVPETGSATGYERLAVNIHYMLDSTPPQISNVSGTYTYTYAIRGVAEIDGKSQVYDRGSLTIVDRATVVAGVGDSYSVVLKTAQTSTAAPDYAYADFQIGGTATMFTTNGIAPTNPSLPAGTNAYADYLVWFQGFGHAGVITAGANKSTFPPFTLSAAGANPYPVNTTATAANDSLTGDDATTTLDGGAGDDTMLGRGGADHLTGGLGNDTVYGGMGADVLVAGAGNNVLVGGDYFQDYLDGGVDVLDYAAWTQAITATSHASTHVMTVVRGTETDTLYGIDHVIGTAFADTMTGRNIATTLSGGAGNDSLTGGNATDALRGDAGADTLKSGDADDALAGGTGNDSVVGGRGNDVYQYALGDGADTVFDTGAVADQDTLIITGYALSAAVFTRVGNTDDFTITFTGSSTDSIRVRRGLEVGANTLETVSFASGGSKTIAAIRAEVLGKQATAGNDAIVGIAGISNTISGAAGNDSLTGESLADSLAGDAGNDTLKGGYGNDTLASGVGADLLVGGRDNDSYLYVKGDGMDTIYETGGTTDADTLTITNHASSVAVYTRVGNTSDFTINFTGTATDSILVQQGLEGGSDALENITFASGGSKTIAQIRTEVLAKQVTTGNDTIIGIDGVANTLSGGAGNDSLTGDTLNDVLNGDAGNDTLKGSSGNDTVTGGLGLDSSEGGTGNDTFFFNKLDGTDVIYDRGGSSDVDALTITGYASTEAVFNRVGNSDDFTITFTSGTDSITVQQGLEVGGDTLETVTFASGGSKTVTQLRTELLAKQVTAGNDTITAFSGSASTINGGAGNDVLTGSSQADLLRGESGNDTLNGSTGVDTVIGGLGVDALTGGSSGDRFEFAAGDMSIGAAADNITDFSRTQADKLALLGMGLSAAGFVGAGAFTAGGAIEFGYTKVAANNTTLIRIDADNNGIADREITLAGIQLDMLASDFLFL
jgi:trimeric autotransporter adhesin